MTTATSTWTLTQFVGNTNKPNSNIEFRVFGRAEIWEQAARENHLTDISTLPDDWDGCGAVAVSYEAIAHSRIFLDALNINDNLPDLILPNAAGTVLFEWEELLGSAHLEIGKSTFGFYTSPKIGESIMLGGPIEVLDAKQIRDALATIFPSINSFSLAIGDNRMGI